MNAIIIPLYETKYTRVSWCTSAELILKLFQVTHEGTSQVKDFKISVLTSQFEAFKMEDCESINVTYNRFNNIVVAL